MQPMALMSLFIHVPTRYEICTVQGLAVYDFTVDVLDIFLGKSRL